jgi:hypothetical protein
MTEELLEHIGARVRAVLREIAPAAADGCPRAISAARAAARILGIAELLGRLARHEHARHPGNLSILRAQMTALLLALEAPELRPLGFVRELAPLHAELGRILHERESGDDFDAVAEALRRKAS